MQKKQRRPLPKFPDRPVLPDNLRQEEIELFAKMDELGLRPDEIDSYVFGHASKEYAAFWKRLCDYDKEISDMGYIINLPTTNRVER